MMSQFWLFITLCLMVLYPAHCTDPTTSTATDDGSAKCKTVTTCEECMGIDPRCSWCFDDAYDDTKLGPGYRCDTRTTLESRGCPAASIESIKSKTVDDGTSATNEQSPNVQFRPRSQTVNLRPNDPMMINFTFKSISDYPVDLYYLIDMSYTMSDDLETVSRMTSAIVDTMRTVTKNLRMGFGAFVDKPVFPFVVPTPEYLQNPCLNVGAGTLQCDPPFLFKHILSLTDDFVEFEAKTKVTRPSGNLDSPEGGLDALLQVAYCDERIGWRENARKIVLFASDGGFHLAGDGRIAGLIRPPPKTCQLTEQPDRFNSSLVYVGWHTADQTDYPSIGEIAQVLTDKDISVIFAVDSKMHALYSSLAEFLPSAAVGILSDSSTNIVQLLLDNYNKIVNKAELLMTHDMNDLEVEVYSKCHVESEFTKKTVCSEHPVGGVIQYQIAVKAKRCFSATKSVNLKMLALDDQATINVQTACDCPACDALPKPEGAYSPRCRSRGWLHCGACQCDPKYSGDFCDCAAQTTASQEAAMLANCTAKGSNEVCSNNGRCVCGQCKCRSARFDGPYCECNRDGCKRALDDDQVCGGPLRGECQCNGLCKCKPGYMSDRCDCMESQEQCFDPKNNSAPMCSGNGVCDCGQCFCNRGFTGYLCNEKWGGESVLCTDTDVSNCVLCLHESLVKSFDEIDAAHTPVAGSTPAPDLYAPAYRTAAEKCADLCRDTVINVNTVKLVDSRKEQQKDDASSLCIIYPDNNCRVFFTYRYSDTIYLNRKVDVSIDRESKCVQPINIGWIVLIVILSIVGGGIILLLIYKLVITIDDRRELAKFEKEGKDVRWQMTQNPIFDSPTTTVTNPLYVENGH